MIEGSLFLSFEKVLSLKLYMIAQEDKLVSDVHNKQGGKQHGIFSNLIMKNECYGVIGLLCAVMLTSALEKRYYCITSKKDGESGKRHRNFK